MEEERNGWYFVKGIKASYVIELHWYEAGRPWAKALVKWDGCVDFNKVSNAPYDLTTDKVDDAQCEEYIHICGIDGAIDQLRQLKQKAIEHFGGDWK